MIIVNPHLSGKPQTHIRPHIHGGPHTYGELHLHSGPHTPLHLVPFAIAFVVGP